MPDSLLEDLIVEQAKLRARGDARAAEYDRRIAELAQQQGLSADELSEVARHVLFERAEVPLVTAGTADGNLAGDYVIYTPERAILPGIAALLGLVIAAMGQPWPGAGLMLCAALLLVFPRRVRRFAVDAAGELHLGSATAPALDWRRVARVLVRRHEPRWGTAITKAARARLEIVLWQDGGSRSVFARGMYFQRAPTRAAVHLVHVQRYLAAKCRQSGMQVAVSSVGFTAERA